MSEICVVGSGPGARSVAGLVDTAGHSVNHVTEVTSVSSAFVVCVGPVGSPVFQTVHEAGGTDWIGVELGGIGGQNVPDISASITVFGQDRGCYECLRSRVGSTQSDGVSNENPQVSDSTAWVAGAIAGQLAIESLESSVAGSIVTIPYADRVLYPVPFCECGEQPDRTPRFDEETLDIDTVSGQVEPAIDPITGLLLSIGEAHSFPLPYYLSSVADTTVFSDGKAPGQAAGAATEWSAAFMKSVGEALERYGAASYRTESLVQGTEIEIAETVSPSAFVCPDQQHEYDGSEPILWIQGSDLGSKDPVLLPAEFVVFPPPEQRFRPAITTGLGLGSSGVSALLSGLYEVVERDAAMIGWYSSFEPLRLEFKDERIETLRRRASAEDLEVTVMLMTQDIDIPVVTACVHRMSEWPQFAVGSSAALDATRAGVGAVQEALQNWMELRAMGQSRAADEPSNIAEYASFPAVARSFIDVRRTVSATAVSENETSGGRDELREVLRRIHDCGLSVYASRLTTRDLNQLGVDVVRVLVPQAQPLFLGESYFGDRASTVPQGLGYTALLDGPEHPYP